MTAVTESVPENLHEHPVALAFAVAALQSVKRDNSSNMKVPATTGEAPSSLSTSSHRDFVSHENDDFRSVEHSFVFTVSEQCPGSGSDSREVDDDHTIATTLSTLPSVSTATAAAVVVSTARGTKNSQEQHITASSRLARSRDRNREHARRTRIRKKAQLAALQTKVARLEAERVVLRTSMEECSIAGILLGLHQKGTTDSKEDPDNDNNEATETQTLLDNVNSTKDASANSPSSTKVALLANGKRKRFLEEDEDTPEAFKQPMQPIRLLIDGKTALVGGGKSHINWKTGIFIDHAGLHSKLTPGQLENLRRERNRMHAKMTRDRKKCFIATIEKTIDELESDVNRMRDILKQVSSAKFTSTVMHHVTPVGSPELSAKEGPDINDEEDVMDDDDDNSSVYSQVVVDGAAPAKKTKHGFSLND